MEFLTITFEEEDFPSIKNSLIMKKIVLYALLILVIGGATAWLIQNQTTSTLNVDETDFGVENIDKVDKIKLKDRSGNESVLEEKEDGNWWVNGNFKANESRLQTLKETIRKVDVKSPVPKAMEERVLKNLASESMEVEIYKDDQLEKRYYVGGDTHDQKGTFMILEGAENPFITHIPGFTGYLSIRYFAEPEEWKTKKAFPFEITDIEAVQVDYLRDERGSYRLERTSDDQYDLFMEGGKKIESGVDQIQIRETLKSVATFQYQGTLDNPAQYQLDSIYDTTPIAEVTVENKEGMKNSMNIHYKPETRRTKSVVPPGEESPHPDGVDLDMRLGFLQGEKEQAVLLQQMNLKPFLRSYRDFLEGGGL